MNHPTSFSREEPIAGYTTTELIGRGGFGEVWKAVAPGGVPKAIKLVFGDDPARAESELRSLNRIKDVRHPLILSIDRIEVIKGTLVIVTELGDCNLKEYCHRFRAQGHVGIPQAEILKLIRDAAEALDYIYAEHSLQHLDVKPENFLVFGKHLKIADFGVVKHIYARTASLVHGLTPIYAAPELFEGKANRHTDQYSLAIVYQEMLTGQLPFDGLSPARLATQHLKEPPNLQALPTRQQPIIARALSKDPHQRFNSCVELVEELEMALKKSSAQGGDPAEPPQPEPGSKTVLMQSVAGSGAETPQVVHAANPSAAPPGFQALIDTSMHSMLETIEQNTNGPRPTILVGLGGTAAHVLQQLRLRFNERVGSLEDAPAFKLLLVDSDVQQLNQINRDEDVWKEIETVAVPLRKSDEYRPQDGSLKRWINRRWLYNIPRDQSTDGIRPLGRLALVTNHQRVMASIEKSIQQCIAQENVDRTAKFLDLPMDSGRPRVVLLASISGGTGGGMLFDVAYALRSKLAQAGFDKDDVDAILLHSTPRKGRDKAIANAYATLQELDHFSMRGNYFPGDSCMGINAFHGNNRTFRDVEFLHLGDNLDEQKWKDAADDVAEYVFCSLLENHRISPPIPSGEGVVGRSIAIQQLGAANRIFLQEYSSQVCLEMLECWRGRELQDRNTVSFTQPTTVLKQVISQNTAKHRQLSQALDQKLESLRLNVESLATYTGDLIKQELGKDPQQYLQTLIRETLNLKHADITSAESVLLVLEKVLTSEDPEESGSENSLFALFLARSETYANKLAAELRTWLQELVNDPKGRVDGAHFAAERAHSVIQDLLSAVARDKAHAREKADGLKLSLTSEDHALENRRSWNPFRSNRPGKLETLLLEYGNAQLQNILLSIVHKQLRTIEAQVGVTIDQVQRLSHDITRLSRKFETRRETESSDISSYWFDESIAWYVQGVRERLMDKRVELVQDLEDVIEAILSNGGYTLQRFLDHRMELGDVLFLPMREQARDVVSRAVAAIHCELIDRDPQTASQDLPAFQLPQLIQNLIATLWKTEPRARVSIVIPKSADAAKLKKQLENIGQSLSVVNLVTNGITLIRREDNVTLYEFAQTLTQGEDVYENLASRLHSREDVDWTPLAPLAPLALPGDGPSNPRGCAEVAQIDQTAILS